MNVTRIPLAAFAALALLSGCCTSSPYDRMENWLIREDAICKFAINADLIYVQDRLYDDMSVIASMNAYAQGAVGGGRFVGMARVFSSLVACADDMDLALEWYFSRQHVGKRPFFFIGEGRGGALLKAYEEAHSDELKDDGLVASFYTDERDSDFVTDRIVAEVRKGIVRVRYREQWGREMPAGMLKD